MELKQKRKALSFFVWFLVVAVLILVLPDYSRADVQSSNTIDNQIENNNNPFFGYEINNFGNNRLQKSIAAMPPSLMFDAPSPTQPYPGKEPPKLFQGRGYYFEQELYSKKEVLDLIKEKKDIIQSFGKLYDVPVEGEPILLLAERPAKHIDLGGVKFTGPPNGSMNETIERAKAYAYYKFGSQKMHITVSYLNYNISSVGNSGGNIGSATVQGEFSHNAGLAPSTGVTASTVYRTPVVNITCYNNQPVKNFPTSGFNLLPGSKQLIVKKYTEGLGKKELAVIDHNSRILADEDFTGTTMVEILVFSPSDDKDDIARLEPIVEEVMNLIGSRLYRLGLDEDFLEKRIKARIASIKNPQIRQVLQKDNAVAGIVLNVKRGG